MLKRLILPSAICAILMSACNSSSNEEQIEYELSSDVAVTSFQLLSNDKVLDSLNNVYFSIDLLNARIFNADSLPYGTPVDRLQVLINTSSASNVTIAFPRPDWPILSLTIPKVRQILSTSQMVRPKSP